MVLLRGKNMKLEAETIIEVPFHDVDMMEIVWHGCYVKYFEVARCVLLEQIDYSYQSMRESGYSWPVIDLHLRYPQPAKFGQKLRVKAKLVEWENCLKIKYLIEDAKTGKRLTKGHSIQVAVNIKTQKLCLASPKVLTQKLEQI
jgi:acyl-CoA thioester hydrolase